MPLTQEIIDLKHESSPHPGLRWGSYGPDAVNRLLWLHFVFFFHLTGANQTIKPPKLKLTIWTVTKEFRRCGQPAATLFHLLIWRPEADWVDNGLLYLGWDLKVLPHVDEIQGLGGGNHKDRCVTVTWPVRSHSHGAWFKTWATFWSSHG